MAFMIPAVLQFTAAGHADPATGRLYGLPAKGTTFYFTHLNALLYHHAAQVAPVFWVLFVVCVLLQMREDRRGVDVG
jgi:hypothetical protein